ncbi:MAG: delta 1-pyrroline-5-carboxylate synthetase [Euryarchaeota archaeon]|nr:delta 1-pyrroline-5-carboxylate synthetase [Euryarchaeota archaeon]
MKVAVKVGGSLADFAKPLLETLFQAISTCSILIVPGGWKFAELVREIDRKYKLSAEAAHTMAILGMDQYGIFLSNLAPFTEIVTTIKEAEKVSNKLPVILPAQLALRANFEPSWDVTSDTIAAYIAKLFKADKFIIATDVDGILTSDPKMKQTAQFIPKISAEELLSWGRKTSVDKELPKFLLEEKISCWVVNGKYPERLISIIEDKKTIATEIFGE